MNHNIRNCKYIHDYDYTENPFSYNDFILYQIGESYCENNAIIPEHQHENFFEVSYIVDGKGMFISNDIKQSIKKGDLFLSLPFERHEIISDSYNPLRYFYISFSFKEDSNFYKILFSDKLLKLEPVDRIYNTTNLKIQNSFNDLISILESRSEVSNLKFELMAKSFALEIYDIFTKNEMKKYSSPNLTTEDSIYYSITKYIDDNLLKLENLQDISLALNHNYSYLSRIFKSKFGRSMHDYFSIQKINMAKKLIEEDKMSLTEIADYLNYSSVYVFSRSFKNIEGVSPQIYKKNLKEN